MSTYKNKSTGHVEIITFPWRWLIYPVCPIELLFKGKIVRALLGILPLFTIIWCFQYKRILGQILEKRGYSKISD